MYNNLLSGTTSSASAKDKIESDVDLEGEIEFLKTTSFGVMKDYWRINLINLMIVDHSKVGFIDLLSIDCGGGPHINQPLLD